jgi:NAD(P)H-nitrite reductase large subunit
VTSDDDALRAKILDSYKVICICNKIKKGTIERAIASGARTLADIKRATRAGSGPCGVERGGVTRCTPVLRDMLDKAK